MFDNKCSENTDFEFAYQWSRVNSAKVMQHLQNCLYKIDSI